MRNLVRPKRISPPLASSPTLPTRPSPPPSKTPPIPYAYPHRPLRPTSVPVPLPQTPRPRHKAPPNRSALTRATAMRPTLAALRASTHIVRTAAGTAVPIRRTGMAMPSTTVGILGRYGREGSSSTHVGRLAAGNPPRLGRTKRGRLGSGVQFEPLKLRSAGRLIPTTDPRFFLPRHSRLRRRLGIARVATRPRGALGVARDLYRRTFDARNFCGWMKARGERGCSALGWWEGRPVLVFLRVRVAAAVNRRRFHGRFGVRKIRAAAVNLRRFHGRFGV
ncbi:hypothetical protein BC936DRAFT_137839 [Jimgerdemannia flammicorona]|uniref:Uncharacterized protein n=2 Tax=Jimgerdemannia flammicorona TaxID=994334 RepID=A0A433QJH5_9FUNG|nr:hypothetical protein BC936DRAFT_137839 [Jimgerdemannia flammicorona]RUS29916.1 hypothetical protein BC938DRAFT_480075 [Jimgerdemannia flammicorona]